jgi:hypothetical protein
MWGANRDSLREDRVTSIVPVFAADLQPLPRLHGGREVIALGVTLEAGTEIERVVAHAVHAEAEVFGPTWASTV